ncbi:hypothetical protein MY3296_000168 [Beauveria thailandica]
MASPSTAWKETIALDESTRFASEADMLTSVQRRHNEFNRCPGKAFHRKQIFAGRGTFKVLPNLPAYARFGVFAQPHVFQSLIRLSNGSWGDYPDPKPDFRGFAIKVLDVKGPRLDDQFSDDTHHILMVQTDPFGANSFDFIKTAQEMDANNTEPDPEQLRFHGFTSSVFHTQTPFCVGPYAARGRLIPSREASNTLAPAEVGASLVPRLPFTWNYQLQFYVNDSGTPIEDATKPWDENESPFITVANLDIPEQENSLSFRNDIHASPFYLWDTVEAHRPLGEVNRARRVVMRASVRTRRAYADGDEKSSPKPATR